MNTREKTLAAAVALLVVVWGGTEGLKRYRIALESRQNTLRTAEEELSRARLATARGLRAQRKLRNWRRQSLPTNQNIAKSLYQDWLQQQLTEAGLQVEELSDKSPRAPNQQFQQTTFIVRARGTLAELTGFLYRFYQAGHLHRISAATLTPTADRKELTISLTADALSLADCKRTDSLTEESSALVLQPLDEVRQDVVSRNVFVAYHPATSESPDAAERSTQEPDPAQAFITGMTYGEGGWQMAIRMHDSGKILFFHEGDAIHIGQFEGQVVELDGRRAIVTTSDQRLQIRLGQNLSQAQPLAGPAG